MSDKPANIIKEGADIGSRAWRNFNGREGQYNPNGRREFNLFMDKESADYLARQGWNIKQTKQREDSPEDWEPRYFLKVFVSYKIYPPKIVLVTSGGKTMLSEELIGLLDDAEILNVDLTVTASWYDVGGRSGYSAYLKTMYVTIEEETYEAKYADMRWADADAGGVY